jgi:mannose-1-phosphate guanylyltransferase/mannose-1-phosphate guanylyltransferase/mannose-6-phosphate isomerase
MFDDCLIMAGGSGTRLWPASSSRRPKQFLPVSGGGSAKEKGSFFSSAVERGLAVIRGGDSRVIIIAGESHIPHVLESCACFSGEEKKRLVLIPEPEAKNTAPAIACALAFTGITGGRKMLVLTSDHIIKPLKTFAANAALAAELAGEKKLAVFGIRPTRPETGYGYIETAKAIAGKNGAYIAAAFREKPDRKTAEQYAASKRFYWNSGMFAFSTDFMAERFQSLAPELFRPFEKLAVPDSKSFRVQKGLRVAAFWPGLDRAYRKTKALSFDYAIAEKCGSTVMVRAEFEWIDVGNWEEYAKLSSGGGEVYRSGGGGCFVDSDIPVALAGVEDLIVVIRSGKDGSPPAALITRKGETQQVRDITEQIKKAGRDVLL